MAVNTLVHIVGNRPQFIKLAVLYDAVKKKTDLKQVILHTGQHCSAEMSDIFFDELQIPYPDVSLHLTRTPSADFVGSAINEMDHFFSVLKDDCMVMVYGDTNSTMAGGLSAVRNGKKLLHFEAGVRTGNRLMPEEINRVVADRIAAVNFCCTRHNRENLLNEGFETAIKSELVLSGDLMLDAFLKIPVSQERIIASDHFILCTIHRAENIGDKKKLTEIVNAVNRIHRDCEVVIPLHPHTKIQLQKFDLHLKCTVLPPLGYPRMKKLMSDACCVITDSGGVCREAFFSLKKSLIIMESPFWPEIIADGSGLLCRAEEQEIVRKLDDITSLVPSFDKNIFGDGKASGIMADYLNNLSVS